jgi:methylglutaconyl-CoA hydratase
MKYSTIKIELTDGIATLLLNRPEIHNAFNPTMVAELTQAINWVNENEDVRCLVLKGAGASFCAGADLEWMSSMKDYSEDENYKDSMDMAECFQTLCECRTPTIAQVHGAAIGGGAGLVAACDIALAAQESVFGFSEVRLGLAPAVISPYVLRKISTTHALDLFLTGRRFNASDAYKMGLVNDATPEKYLEKNVQQYTKMLLSGGPKAQSEIKRIIAAVPQKQIGKDANEYTSRIIAQLRVGDEGQEGIAAFFQKRKASWS